MLSLILRALGTFLIVNDTRVDLCNTVPRGIFVPSCSRLQIFSVIVSLLLSEIPCRKPMYISSVSTSKLLDSSSTESR